MGPRARAADAREGLSVTAVIGRRLPDIELAATDRTTVNPARIAGTVVIFCYPWTGRPGFPNPPDWDVIPGAHGSTPQAEAYARLHEQFVARGVRVHGLSLQTTEYQREFAERARLPFALLSDCDRRFSGELGLPTFETGGAVYLERLTLICDEGVVRGVRYPVPKPEDDAAEVLRPFSSLAQAELGIG